MSKSEQSRAVVEVLRLRERKEEDCMVGHYICVKSARALRNVCAQRHKPKIQGKDERDYHKTCAGCDMNGMCRVLQDAQM